MQVSEEKMSREENTNQMGEKIAANKQDVIFLHIAVMLFGLAGVVAQFVKVPAIMVALGRVISSSLMLLVIVLVKKDKLRLNCGKDYVLIILTGIVMAVHWTTFFQSIKVSTVAIGAITFYISVVPDIFGAVGLPRKNMHGKYRENHPAFGWRDDNHS